MKYFRTINSNLHKPTGCKAWALFCGNSWFLCHCCMVFFFMTFPALAQRVESEAAAGKTFGVGRITIELPETMLPQPLGVEGLALTDRDGRALSGH